MNLKVRSIAGKIGVSMTGKSGTADWRVKFETADYTVKKEMRSLG